MNEGGGDLSLLDEALGESIRGLEHGLSVYDKEDTSDGGEGDSATTTASSLDRSQRRKNIVETILSQQHEHKESGIDDPKGLQVTSNACTQWARDRAREQAQKDFDDAVQVWKEDATCASLLPSVLQKKESHTSIFRKTTSLLSAPAIKTSEAEQRQATLNTISTTLACALEELDDLDF